VTAQNGLHRNVFQVKEKLLCPGVADPLPFGITLHADSPYRVCYFS